MRAAFVFVLSSWVLASGAAVAQHASPYVDDTAREVKSLSAEEVRDYLDGKGMGLARAAELNGYPGPMHVLELGDRLGLSAEQRARTEALLAAMRTRAIAAGREFVDAERELDRLFRLHAIDEQSLADALTRVARQQAEVRRVHLDAHLKQAAILTPEQARRYAELRGYGDAAVPAGNDNVRRH